MVTGSVNARYEPVLRLRIRDSAGHEREIDAVIDTGFSGSLTLPSTLVTNLGLVRRSRSSAGLMTDNVVEFDQFAAIQEASGVILLGGGFQREYEA